jgi:hypothetical protein
MSVLSWPIVRYPTGNRAGGRRFVFELTEIGGLLQEKKQRGAEHHPRHSARL